MPRFLAFAAAICLTLVAAATHAAPPPDVEVTTCGQVIPNKTLGYLTADLDCTGYTGGPSNVLSLYAGAAVYLGKKSRLDLRGFTITGGQHGVMCDALVCRHNRFCTRGPCEIFNGTLVSSISAGNGVAGNRLSVHDVSVTGFLFGVTGLDQLQLTNATVADSGAIGVAGKKLTIVGTTITNNAYYGVDGWTDRGYGVRLTNSTVTGNGTAPLCGSQACADLGSVKQPRVINSSCGTSLMVGGGLSWGICAND